MFDVSALDLARFQFAFTVSVLHPVSDDHHRARELPLRSRGLVADPQK